MKKYINKILRESLNKILLKEDIDVDLFFMYIKQIIEQLQAIYGLLMNNKDVLVGEDVFNKVHIRQSTIPKFIHSIQYDIANVHNALHVRSKTNSYVHLKQMMYGFQKNNWEMPTLVNSIGETIKQLKDLLFLDKGEINNLSDKQKKWKYNDIVRVKDSITSIYNLMYDDILRTKNVVKKDEPKKDEPKKDEPKEVTNLFGEPFDINISGTYYEPGFNTHRYGGTEIRDVRSIIKRPLFEPIFTDSVQSKKSFGSNKPLPEKKVFTLIDGLTKDLAGRRGAHTISFVFDKDSKITLDDVKGELQKLNKEININHKKGKDENVSFEERRSNYDKLYRNYFFNTKFKPNSTKYILKFIDDYVKKHNNQL